MTTQTQKFISERTQKLRVAPGTMLNGELVPTHKTFYTAWEITTEVLSDIPENMKSARWYPEFGGQIKAVRQVKVRSNMYLPEFPETANIPDHNWGETYIEIETDHAIACIVSFTGAPEVQGVIVKGYRARGKKPECMTLGTWNKYNGKRGHGMSWLRYKHARGLCQSPESKSDVCPGRAYATLAGKSY